MQNKLLFCRPCFKSFVFLCSKEKSVNNCFRSKRDLGRSTEFLKKEIDINVKFSIFAMKKKTTLELVEQSEKVSLYSISFAKDRTTEFERFLSKFEKEASLNEDYQRILYALSIILDKGALERYFRPEGKMNDDLYALPIDGGRIRLFCLRILDEILILGNGDQKRTSTYEQDAKLYGYALDLQKFDRLLRKDIEAGIVTVEEKELTHIEDREYLL